MTSPAEGSKDNNQLLLEALVSLTDGMSDLKGSVNDLYASVREEAAAREHKADAIEDQTKSVRRLTGAVLIGVLVLIIVAFLNFSNTSRTQSIAEDTRQTNDLIAGCFQPNTPCTISNIQQQANVLNLIRQTQLVVAVCQRLNPVDPNKPDPEGNTAKLTACIQSYYPDFKTPPHATPVGK